MNTPRASGSTRVPSPYPGASTHPCATPRPELEKNAKSAATWSQAVLLFAFLVVIPTSVCFAVGAVTYYNSNGPTVPAPPLLSDTTFYILLSQSLPNILTAIFEGVKVFYVQDSGGHRRTHMLFLVALVFAAVLSLVAPIVYGCSNRARTWIQVQVMILSVAAALAMIMSGMCSIFEAGYAKEQKIRQVEDAHTDAMMSNMRDENIELQERVQGLEAQLEERNRKWYRPSRRTK